MMSYHRPLGHCLLSDTRSKSWMERNVVQACMGARMGEVHHLPTDQLVSSSCSACQIRLIDTKSAVGDGFKVRLTVWDISRGGAIES